MTEDNNDNWENIEWEQDEELQAQEYDEEVSPSTSGTLLVYQPEEKDAPKTKRRKVQAMKFGRDDYLNTLTERQRECRVKLQHALTSCRICLADELTCILQSLLPLRIINQFSIKSNQNAISFMQVRDWLRGSYRPVPAKNMTSDEGRDGSTDIDDLLLHVVTHQRGSLVQLTQLLHAVYMSLGVSTKFIVAFHLCPLHPKQFMQYNEDQPFFAWLEVMDTDRRWWPCDVQHGIHESPSSFTQRVFRGRPPAWIFAFEHVGNEMSIQDVSLSYQAGRSTSSSMPPKMLQETEEMFRSWLVAHLLTINQNAASQTMDCVDLSMDGDNSNEAIDITENDFGMTLSEKERRQQERMFEEFALQRQKSEQEQLLPTSFAGFQNHPKYLLERHLKVEEVLHPNHKKVVAMFKGEAVYLAEHREQLGTSLHWRRQMRQVLPDIEPAKVVKRSVRDRSSNEGNEGSFVMKEIRLFGSWQTEAMIIPEIIDGVIPCNEFGNLEVWEGLAQFVPKGAVYEEGAFTLRAAKNLGVQHVPAVTHFDRRADRNVPRISGVVVLKKDCHLLRDAAFQLEQMAMEKEQDRRFLTIVKRWEVVTKGLVNRAVVFQKYGQGLQQQVASSSSSSAAATV